MTPLGLSLKAEVLLSMQLIARHRAPRLVGILALGIVAASAGAGVGPERAAHALIVVAGSLAVVAGSRLLAPGPAFAAGRMVVADWWIVPVGRTLGLLCLVAPVLLGAVLALAATATTGLAVARVVGAGIVYAACAAACVTGLAPRAGASAAAATGFLAVWLGLAPPSSMAPLFAGSPVLQHTVIWLWNILPLPWRALDWLSSGAVSSAGVVVGWLVLGLGVAARQLASPAPSLAASDSG